MRPHTLSKPVLISCLLLLLIPLARAQTPSVAHVKCVVEDEIGAIIPNADVVFTRGAEVTKSRTNAEGAAIVDLATGTYEASVSRACFGTKEVADIKVNAPDPLSFKVKLQMCEDCCLTDDSVRAEVPTETSNMPDLVEAVRVPDAATAISIARKVAIKKYGKHQISREEPLKAALQEGVWTVYGTLCCSDAKGKGRTCETGKCVGGVVQVKIRQSDGKILSVAHTV